MSKLQAKKREGFTRAALTEIRTAGLFPAVIYGKGVESEPVSVEESEFIKVIREVGRNGLISLDVDGSKHDVILQEYQKDPIKGFIVHADFLAVDRSSEITSQVRVDIEGEAVGSKEGGVIQQPLFELNVTAKVSDFPEHVSVDVSELAIGDSISVGDIRDKYDFTIENEDEDTIVSVLPPQKLEETEEGTEEASETEAEASAEGEKKED
ncbi:50S ribosomal protein L25/general stress protein Ctc [Domibacillus sp. A3M-37]|jgi:large subunit ribosomal protein L25|uniref:50S ribosomal protein L25/general stress protein Ctc n=1 Tax=Domibacillus TaxID=1433999 RepID=UPI000617F758|nr:MULTISPECIES: 50S ribosomal protein L25/general stress protein Ctc [Domibacillus]MCP3764501.1 50S ribosomal protein L25/general stress protein Ctc [Domibacillus sp. A3M-37]